MRSPMVVSIQGHEASFHEVAAKSYFQHPIKLLYRDSFKEVFDDLTSGRADKILVATSNSVHGDIQEVKTLIESHDLTTEGLYKLPIDQQLIGIPGVTIADIKQVISHPIALSQCKIFLTHNPRMQQITYFDTAAAAKLIKDSSDHSMAAIAGRAAAELYGLEIIKEAIQDDPTNTTTFQSFSLKM